MVTPQSNALERKVRNQLEELRRQLNLIQSGLIVATQLLKHQDAEQDRDVANVIEFDIGERLDRQIERTSAVIDLIQSHPVDSVVVEPVEFTRVRMQ